MRKIKIFAVLLAAGMLLTGCNNAPSDSSSSSSGSESESSSEKTVSEKTAELLESIEFPEMVEVKSDKLSVYYDIDADELKEFSAYVCGSGAMPDEFGIFVANDADDASDIKEDLEERIEKQRSTYQDYTPDEMYKIEDSFVEVSGNTVIYAVCADNSTAKSILS